MRRLYERANIKQLKGGIELTKNWERIWLPVISAILIALTVVNLTIFGGYIVQSRENSNFSIGARIPPSPASIQDPLNVPCYPGDDNRASALCASWKSADAARKQAEWGIAAFIIGVFVNVATLIGVGMTYWQTRRSANAALRQARAATAQLKLSRQVMKADGRAWLGMKVSIAGPLHVGGVGEKRRVLAQIKVEMTNFGRSPAIDVRMKAKLFFRVAGEEPVEDFDEFCRMCIADARNGKAILPTETKSEVMYSTSDEGGVYRARKHSIKIKRPYAPALYVCGVYKSAHTESV